MSALFRIVYAAHANGTHHKLALDALNGMRGPDAEAWRRVILKHVDKYLEGSKAPDTVFKDFKNHVLHVGEKYWGGAPEKVEEWYAKTVAALRAGDWPQAAYAAGVTSHYYTDPCMPFHTAQTEAENSIHRATEWSINRSYDALRKIGEARFSHIEAASDNDDLWLQNMTCDGAEYAHRYYEKLIAHYDIHRGTVRPEEGLDAISRDLVAELLMYAAGGFAHILDRATAEAGVAAPAVTLTLETFLATLRIPSKWLEKRLSNAEDRQLVHAMYDELRKTGRVDATLSEDDRAVRDLHAVEVLAPKIAKRRQDRSARMPGDTLTVASAFDRALAGSAFTIANAITNPTSQPSAASTNETARAMPRYEPDIEPTRTEPPPAVHTLQPSAPSERKSYLKMASPLEDAPSIGPKMAERFARLGVHTVADFLGQNPHDLAELIDDNQFDAEVLTDWQDQADLVIAVAGLRGTHAQLLVGAGYRTADAIADADAVELSADVLTFATSSAGKRILRDGNPPDIEKIKDWVEAAREAMAA